MAGECTLRFEALGCTHAAVHLLPGPGRDEDGRRRDVKGVLWGCGICPQQQPPLYTLPQASLLAETPIEAEAELPAANSHMFTRIRTQATQNWPEQEPVSSRPTCLLPALQ